MKKNFKLGYRKGLVKNAIIYTLTDALSKAIGFILLPFVSYYLPPEGMGLATNFSVLSSIVSLLSGLAIINSLPYFFYERTKDENRTLVSNLIIMSLAACAFLLLLIVVFHNSIFNYLKLDYRFQLLTVVFVIASVLTNLDLQLFRLEDKPNSFAIYQVVQICLHCLLVVMLVIVFRGGGEGKIWAELTTVVAMGLVHLVTLIKRGYIGMRFDKTCMKTLLNFGLPLMPHSISFWFKGGADKVFITTFAGLATNGIYSMALSMGSLYTMVQNAFFNAYVPDLQRKLANIAPGEEEMEKIKIVKISYMLILIFFFVSILAIFGAWIIIQFILDDKYEASFAYVPGIILSLYIYAIYSLSIQFIYKQKKTLILGLITFTGSLVQMGLSYLFVRQFGAMGAVFSSIVGSILISIGIFTYSNKVYPLPWFYFLNRKKKIE